MEEQVTFYNDNQHIFGVLHLPQNLPAPGIIMCHGFTGQRCEAHRLAVLTARQLADLGVASLRFDFRGNGDSAGDFRDITISKEISDAKIALDYMESRPEIDSSRLGVSGLSMGGLVGACLAGRDSRVKALSLWAAAGNPQRFFDKFDDLFAGNDILDYGGFELSRTLVDDILRLQPYEELKNFSGPALVIHGTNDEIVPVAEAHGFAQALAGRARLHLLEGADHVFSNLPWTREVITLTRDFFVETLKQ